MLVDMVVDRLESAVMIVDVVVVRLELRLWWWMC